MGRIGLTEKQQARLEELKARHTGIGKSLTPNMEGELAILIFESEKPDLPQTCKTYLHEWYANDEESLFTKETNKGNVVELDAIDFMCEQLNLGIAERNLEQKEDEYITGTCDVDSSVLDAVIDIKSPWNKTTLQSNIDGMDEAYKYQGIGYCHLWNRAKFILFYALMDTPEDINYGKEVIYSNLPPEERWIAYETKADTSAIKRIIERVKLCRAYLEQYDTEVRSKMGKINVV